MAGEQIAEIRNVKGAGRRGQVLIFRIAGANWPGFARAVFRLGHTRLYSAPSCPKGAASAPAICPVNW